MTTNKPRGPTPKPLPEEAISWLGQRSDRWIAKRFRCSVHVVARTRERLSIPACPQVTSLPPALLAQLGKKTDPALVAEALALGVEISKQRVAALRKARGIPSCSERKKRRAQAS